MAAKGFLDKARTWAEAKHFDQATRAQVGQWLEAGAEGELAERFEGELEFGTAGLRGVLGLGSLRMNEYTVARAAGGLARCLLELYPEARTGGVVVGYDCRQGSEEFAAVCAEVLCAAGLPVKLFSALTPTPLVPFAATRLGAFAGVMVTSSHNPPKYNGVKVYWTNGAQIVSPVDQQIAQRMGDDWGQAPARMELAEARRRGLLVDLGEELVDAYVDWAVKTATPRGVTGLKVLYTPLGGTGYRFVRDIFQRAGFADFQVVPEERDPDPAFAGLPAPNPELPVAWKRALEQARKGGVDLVLATDGDGDRIGVAVRARDGEYKLLSGNQIGCIMLHYLLEYRRETGWTGREFAVSSVVSTPLARRICEHFGARFTETLTGFKWMGNVTEELVAAGGDFVLAFEEAFGVTFGDSRDKDGMTSILLLSEAAARSALRGKTLLEYLDDIFTECGLCLEDAAERFYEGVEGPAKMASVLGGLREHSPETIAGVPVVAVRDVLTGELRRDGRVEPFTALPKQDLLSFYLEDGSWVSVRPSGTEPKVKAYVGVVLETQPKALEEDRARAKARLENLKQAAAKLLG
jgi:phosphomannomutase